MVLRIKNIKNSPFAEYFENIKFFAKMADGLEMDLLSNVELAPTDNNNADDVEEDIQVRKVLLERFGKWPYMGIILASVSSLFFSLCSAIVQLVEDVSPPELAVYRFIGILLPSLPILVWENVEIFPKGKRLMLILRSLVGATGLILSFYAFRYMHLAEASIIVFSVPVFVSIFARIFLKEPCGVVNVVTIVLVLMGVILMTDEEMSCKDKYSLTTPILAACGSTLFGASAYILLRALKSLHFAVVMANFGFFALIETLIITIATGSLSWPSYTTDKLLIVALGIFSFIGQVLLTLAFKLENAGPISVARTSDIVFAFIWQILFFHQAPHFTSIIGAIYVVSSVLTLAFRKWVISLPSDDPRKARFHLLTK